MQVAVTGERSAYNDLSQTLNDEFESFLAARGTAGI